MSTGRTYTKLFEKMSVESVNTFTNAFSASKNMDMDRAITNARRLYNITRNHELKVVMDRAELCWGKWRDDSDYRALIDKCVDVMSRLF